MIYWSVLCGINTWISYYITKRIQNWSAYIYSSMFDIIWSASRQKLQIVAFVFFHRENAARCAYLMCKQTQANLIMVTSLLQHHFEFSWSESFSLLVAMTTDNTGHPLTDETGNPATPFAMGSGHFNPKRAADPGLVYDASYMGYLLYTCNLGVTQNFNITYNCPKSFLEPFELNYPSIQIHRLYYTKTIKRNNQCW